MSALTQKNSSLKSHHIGMLEVPINNYFVSSSFPLRTMARVTGLEPAASGVTGRRSNQLSYTR